MAQVNVSSIYEHKYVLSVFFMKNADMCFIFILKTIVKHS